MITLLEDPALLPDVIHPLFTRSLSSYFAYGNGYPFCTVWVQTIDNAVTALLSRVDGAVTLWNSSEWDEGEVVSFLQTVGFSSLTTAAPLPFPLLQEGLVFYKQQQAASADLPNDCMAACHILKQLDPSMDLDAAYTDLQHRVRHGHAAVSVIENGSCAFAHIAGDSALIFGVATLPEHRGKGYAARCITRLEGALPSHLFILCKPKLRPFYQRLGYEAVSSFYEYTGESKT